MYFSVIEGQFLSADDEVVEIDSICPARNTHLNLGTQYASYIQIKAIMFMEAKSSYCEWTVSKHFIMFKEMSGETSLDNFDVFVSWHIYRNPSKN